VRDRAQVRSKCAERHFAHGDGLSPLSGWQEGARRSFFGAGAHLWRWRAKNGRFGALVLFIQRRQTIAARKVARGALRAHLRSIAR